MPIRSVRFSNILDTPTWFSSWIDLLGARACNRRLTGEHLPLEGIRTVLDVGCGIGNMLEALPHHIDYVGIDRNFKYIEFAKRRYGGRGRFLVGDVTDITKLGVTHVDAVILFGVLHHISDGQADDLFVELNGVMRPGAVFLTLDPCRQTTNSRFVNFVIDHDRGEHIRDELNYLKICRSFHGSKSAQIYQDLIRIPYTHIVMRGIRQQAGPDYVQA